MDTPPPSRPRAGGAAEHPLGEVQPGPEGLRRATDRAGVQQRLISGEAEQPELKDRLHQGPGLFQGVQRVEAVEQQGEQLRAGLSLLGGGLRHLGKIEARARVSRSWRTDQNCSRGSASVRVVNSPRSDRVSSEYTSSWLAAVSLLFFRRQPGPSPCACPSPG